MATLAELEQALQAADAAGDVEAAQAFAAEIDKAMRQPSNAYLDRAKKAADIGKRAIASAAKGVAALPALGLDVLNALGGGPPTTADFAATKAVQGIGPTPETRGEKLADALIGGAAGGGATLGALIGRESAKRGAAIGATAGGTAEGAAQVLDTEDPILRLVAGLAGGVGAGIVTAPRGNARDIARFALEDIPEADVQRAIAEMSRLQGLGLSANLAQGLGRPSDLDALIEALATTRYGGGQVREQLRRQPEEVTQLSRDFIPTQQPGTVRSRQAVANQVQDAGTQRFRDLAAQRTQRFREILGDAAETPIDQARLGAVDDQLRGMAEQFPNTSYAAAVEGLRSALRSPKKQGDAADLLAELDKLEAGGFLENAGQVNAVLRDQASAIKAPSLAQRPLDAENAARFREAIGLVRKELGEVDERFSKAYADYSNFSKTQIDPLKKGPLGRVTGKGTAAAVEPVKERAFKVLEASEGVDPAIPAGRSDIEQLYTELNRADPDAWPNLVATSISNKIAKVVPDKTMAAPEDVARQLKESLGFGNTAQREALRRATAGVEESYGLPKGTLIKGLENFMDITVAAARRPPRVSGATAQELKQDFGESALADQMEFLGYSVFRTASKKRRFAVSKTTKDQLGPLLTTPEGARKLAELAREPVMSERAQAIVASIVGGMDRTEDEADAIQR